jgi:hypothetical protein
LHRHAAENIAQADALIFGRATYELMEAGWRPFARAGARPEWMEPWMEPFARTIDAAKKYIVSPFLLVGRKRSLGPVALPRFQSAKEET